MLFCMAVQPGRSADTILNTVLPKLAGGSIIPCHNNGYEIEHHLPPLIERAQVKGYTFVTAPERLLSGETVFGNNGVQPPATGETGVKSGQPAKEQSSAQH